MWKNRKPRFLILGSGAFLSRLGNRELPDSAEKRKSEDLRLPGDPITALWRTNSGFPFLTGILKYDMKTILLFPVLATVLSAGVASAQSSKTIPNFASANLVLGDTDFRGGGSGATSAKEFSSVLTGDVAIDPATRKVFVADGFRVLRFKNADALTSGSNAEAVFGQGNFTSTTVPSTINEFRFSALGINVDHKGRLWIADINNNRVLRFDNASTSGNFPAATRVYGQQNFTTDDAGHDGRGLAGPADVVVDSNDRLWVADADNNRVLRFDNISNKPNGASADAVLGQATLSTVGNGPDGLSQSALDTPYSLAISTTGTLFVSDRDNNRVLRFTNAASLGNGANATAVLGQAGFDTESTDVLASKLNKPSGISISTDDILWVADRYNHRVLRFNSASTKANGASADGVLGQPDFFSDKQNNNTQGAFSQNSQGFLFPEHLLVDSVKGGVWISDSQNKRVLRFGGVTAPPKDTTKPKVKVAKVPGTTTSAKVKIKGTATDNVGVKRVQYGIGNAAAKNASGTTKWSFEAKLKKGVNKITVYATDAAGNTSVKSTVTIKRK
ncbi:MAG: hypothetical protein EOP88_17270 [Verrucomicrobiaceae bacterium]|nr:MAG: hypothetical protein EOP88_17270 [Verrucomicrobiaceae bacterium]